MTIEYFNKAIKIYLEISRIERDIESLNLSRECDSINISTNSATITLLDCKDSQEFVDFTIKKLSTRLETLKREFEELGEPNQPIQWMPATQIPNDDTECVIIDEHGSRYFLSPINGHWPKRVKYWCHLPKMP